MRNLPPHEPPGNGGHELKPLTGVEFVPAKSEESFMQEPNEIDTDVYLKYDQVPRTRDETVFHLAVPPRSGEVT